MFSLIGNTLKYSALVLVVLVLSHIIEIRGTTISQYVEHSLHWMGAGGPKRDILRASRELTNSVTGAFRSHASPDGTRAESEISASDERQLNHLILRSQKK